MIARLPLVLLAVPLWAADDASAIVQRLVDATKANAGRVEPYTYTEEAAHFDFGKKGVWKQTYTETREVIFIEGLPFHKLVLRNGKPLPRKEQAAVEQAMNETAAERRKRLATPRGGQIVLNGKATIDMGSNAELLTLFDNRVAGEEEIRGRKAWVIESEPKAGHTPANQHEREVMSFRRKTWVDEAESEPVRVEYTVTDAGVNFAMPGSYTRLEMEKVGDAWLESGLRIEIWRRDGKTYSPAARTDYTCGKFQKFDVQSTVTIGQ